MINKLIEIWNKRPARVEPDNESHLAYVFHQLLPAVRDSMPDIERLTSQPAPTLEPVALTPSIDPPQEQALEPSSHNQDQILKTDDTSAALNQTADTADKHEASAATPAAAGPKPVSNRGAALARARAAKAKKRAGALREAHQ